MDEAAKETLRRALAGRPPPSEEAGAGVRPSAVMALLYDRDGGLFCLLIRRSRALKLHPGEIAFPGGGYEECDRSLMHTALRETSEEVGVDPQDVEVLGELGRFTTSSDYLISCFVGTIDSPGEFRVLSDEVDGTLEVPVAELLCPGAIRDDMRVIDGDLVALPCFAYGGNLVFGATARILERLIELLAQIEPDTAGVHLAGAVTAR